MKKRFINVECFRSDGSKRDDFTVEHATVEGLMAVLQLAKVGDEVIISIDEEEIQFNSHSLPASSKDA